MAATAVRLVPLALASLLTGFVASFGTKWGAFQLNWIDFMLVTNVFEPAAVALKRIREAEGKLANRGSIRLIENGRPIDELKRVFAIEWIS